MPSVHSLLGASGAHRWLHCPPSVRLTENIADRPTAWAEEGTLAHAHCAKALKEYLGEDTTEEQREIMELSPRYASREMPGYVRKYVDFVLRCYEDVKRGDKNARLLVEVRSDYSIFAPEGFGTTDAAILSEGTLHIIDFKYGQGVKVEAERNPQLMLYALGLLTSGVSRSYRITDVLLSVIQPRIGGHQSHWWMEAPDLISWGVLEVRPRALLAYEGKGDFLKGEWCRFCKGKHFCKESDAAKMIDDIL